MGAVKGAALLSRIKMDMDALILFSVNFPIISFCKMTRLRECSVCICCLLDFFYILKCTKIDIMKNLNK